MSGKLHPDVDFRFAGPVYGPTMSGTGAGQAYRDQLFALCAQGQHESKREYGLCGIITAIFLFPLGLICLFSDSSVKCSRCGVALPTPAISAQSISR